MDATATAAASACDKPTMTETLNSMTEDQRNLVCAALDAQSKQINTLKEKTAALSNEKKAMQQDAECDAAMLETQLKQFIANMGDTAKNFGINEESCAKQLQSENPLQVRRAVDRMLMCCNTAMMANAAKPAMASPAAAFVATNEPAMQVDEPSAGSKRKAETFEPTDDDAASVLRRALQNFN